MLCCCTTLVLLLKNVVHELLCVRDLHITVAFLLVLIALVLESNDLNFGVFNRLDTILALKTGHTGAISSPVVVTCT